MYLKEVKVKKRVGNFILVFSGHLPGGKKQWATYRVTGSGALTEPVFRDDYATAAQDLDDRHAGCTMQAE